VFLVGIDDVTKKKVAVKIMEKRRMDEKLQRKVSHEIHALKRLQGHPNIVELIDVINHKDGSICLVMEYCCDGDLFGLIVNRKKVRISENEES
jgi:serine/threonine protein kinase